MDDGKTIEQLGLDGYKIINLKNDDLILLYKDIYRPQTDCDGFDFSALSYYSRPITYPPSPIEYTVLFEGVAYFDGVRHLYFGKEETNNYGYLYYQDLPDLIMALQALDKLQVKKCEYVREERESQ